MALARDVRAAKSPSWITFTLSGGDQSDVKSDAISFCCGDCWMGTSVVLFPNTINYKFLATFTAHRPTSSTPNHTDHTNP